MHGAGTSESERLYGVYVPIGEKRSTVAQLVKILPAEQKRVLWNIPLLQQQLLLGILLLRKNSWHHIQVVLWDNILEIMECTH